MRVLLIRHGETASNTRGVIHKQNDPTGLSHEGLEQSGRLIPICNAHKVEFLYTSGERRALETTERIARNRNKPYKILDELRERDWGKWSGKKWEEVKIVLDKLSLEDRYTFVPPGGESWEQMDARLATAISYITSQTYRSVAIITHAGVLRALMPLLTNEPKKTSLSYDFGNGQVTILDMKT